MKSNNKATKGKAMPAWYQRMDLTEAIELSGVMSAILSRRAPEDLYSLLTEEERQTVKRRAKEMHASKNH